MSHASIIEAHAPYYIITTMLVIIKYTYTECARTLDFKRRLYSLQVSWNIRILKTFVA